MEMSMGKFLILKLYMRFLNFNFLLECGNLFEMGQIYVTATATIRIQLSSVIHHEDVGYSCVCGLPNKCGILKAQAKQVSFHNNCLMIFLRNG